MRIYLGPAGIPLSAPERTTPGGIRRVAELGLNAQEVEFVRGVAMGNEAAKQAGELARELGVLLSVHCPYFINLCSQEPRKLAASKKRILDSVERAHHMGAYVALFHPGFYGKLQKEDAYKITRDSCSDLVERMREEGWTDVKLGLETTGKNSTFGTLEEIVNICKEVKGCVPVVDFAHLFARNGGKIDYHKIFEELKPLKLKHLHTHYTSVMFNSKGEVKHLTWEIQKPPFLPLAKEILKHELDITIISESPTLEQDSLEQKKVFEKLGYHFS